jgi:hypothetical protein
MSEAGSRLEVAVKDQWIEVSAVWPDDGSHLVIDVYLGEEARIGQRLKHRAMQCSGEVYVTQAAVAESEPQLVVAQNLNGRDLHVLHIHPILRQRIDGVGQTAVLGALPVGFQLLPMQPGPFGHQLERAAG